MSVINSQKAYLVLQDGTVFEGNAIGKIGTTTGEIAFNTGMTGYQEVFTDPSYFGQIVVMTMDHIGNYGAAHKDAESDSIKISGLVCKNYSPMHSRTMADSSLNDYFIENGFTGISDVDTREIVKHIRDAGAMNAIISSEILDVEELKKRVKEVPSMEGLELSSKVWSKESYELNEGGAKKVALLDLGSKKNIIDCLVERGCHVKVFPGDTSYADMKAWNPDGFMISNGPGDPAAVQSGITLTQSLLEHQQLPMFGICLGHQILGLALGGTTFKLAYGHRGLNHPCGSTGQVEITSQNHGFALDAASLPVEKVEVTHFNLNDRTVAAFAHRNQPVFGVQYPPEASPGPHDADHHFARFAGLMADRR